MWCEGDSGCDATTLPSAEQCQVDESKNARGPNRCESSDECSGLRSCSNYGWCKGDSFCSAEDDSNAGLMMLGSCSIEESENKDGSGRCDSDEDCKGGRTCAKAYLGMPWRWCEGDDGCPAEEL